MATVGKRGNKEKHDPPPAYTQTRKELIRYLSLIVRAVEHDQWDDVILFAGQAIGPAVRLLMMKEE